MTEEQRIKVLEIFPNIYHELFTCKQDIAGQFSIDVEVLADKQIIYAFYEYEDYSGSATVFFYNNLNDTFYEVHGGHCSCYGLEGQWDEEEIGSFDLFMAYVTRQGYNKKNSSW